ncbi:hypothetical protein GCM10010253_55950 [Streptomyces badius]|uniref:Uncharacterized protein n=1 Tax=Streptomyces badius TaxID=1941 RepID=A0ABQ2TJQ7_STRBA|nr:hypothetical protein GCM10010253_55950 [Streptomyces badius]
MGPVPVSGGLHRLGERRVRSDDIQQTVQAHEVSVRDQISGGSDVAGSRLLAGQREGPDTWDAPGVPGYDPGVTAAPATGREAPAVRPVVPGPPPVVPAPPLVDGRAPFISVSHTVAPGPLTGTGPASSLCPTVTRTRTAERAAAGRAGGAG